jgi:hypothetical protein
VSGGSLLANGFCSPTNIANFENDLKSYWTQFKDKNNKNWDNSQNSEFRIQESEVSRAEPSADYLCGSVPKFIPLSPLNGERDRVRGIDKTRHLTPALSATLQRRGRKHALP